MQARVLTLVVFCSLATIVMAVPIEIMNEQWESYAAGADDAAYNANWATIPGAARYEVEVTSGTAPTAYSPPNGLKIGKQATYGITRDLTPEIVAAVPDGTMVTGTDGDVLSVRFIVDFNSINNQTEDIFVELSMAHILAASSEASDSRRACLSALLSDSFPRESSADSLPGS